MRIFRNYDNVFRVNVVDVIVNITTPKELLSKVDSETICKHRPCSKLICDTLQFIWKKAFKSKLIFYNELFVAITQNFNTGLIAANTKLAEKKQAIWAFGTIINYATYS